MHTLLRWATLTVVACLPSVVWAAAGITLSFTTAPGGLAITGGAPITAGTMAVGNINGLGVLPAAAPPSVISSGVAGGVLYTSRYTLNVTLSGSAKNNNVNITAQVTTNFLHPAILGAQNCQPAACNAGGSFVTVPTAGAINVIPTTLVGTSQTFTPTVAIYAANTNGASAFTGADLVTITFTATAPGASATATLVLTATLQNALALTLGTAPGSLTISPASDYNANFGNVNGLGIGTPGAGLTKTAVAGGIVYSTAYLLQPTFSNFNSSSGHLTVYVSTDFAHPNTLKLQDSSALTGPFTPISKLAATPTTISAAAASGSSITRYLGVLVSSANGAGSFPGAAGSAADSATLTFTLTVP